MALTSDARPIDPALSSTVPIATLPNNTTRLAVAMRDITVLLVSGRLTGKLESLDPCDSIASNDGKNQGPLVASMTPLSVPLGAFTGRGSQLSWLRSAPFYVLPKSMSIAPLEKIAQAKA